MPPGMRRFSFAHSPRSINRHRSLQKGRHGWAASQTTIPPQVGHCNVMGEFAIVHMYLNMSKRMYSPKTCR